MEPHLLVKSPDPSHVGETRPLSNKSPKTPPPTHTSPSTEGRGEEEEGTEILEGVVICFSKKLSSLSSELSLK